jgi:acetyl-CoA carboxylase biotin carboxyl carrier protein
MSDDKTESDVAFIRALAAILKDSDLNEVEVRREYGEGDEMKVRLTKQMPMPIASSMAVAPAAPAPAPSPAPTAQPAAEAAPDPASAAGMVPSPMVGTAYLAPEPGASTFVSVGDTVSEGQTILIVEAMKTMNQIAAPRSGTVRTILVSDGDPVEFGMPLMIIE